MTIVMPNDVMDTEVYVKTPREHTGIQMDPWMSCTWRRTWSSTYPPNTQTKEKMRKYKLQKAGRRISLFRTAGRSKQMKNRYWSPRPEARHQLHCYAERRTPSPHNKQQPVQDHQPSHTTQTLLHKNRWREEYSEDSSTDDTGHPDQKLDISSTAMLREEPHLLTISNNLFRTTSPVTLPRPCYTKIDGEKNTLKILQQMAPYRHIL